MVQETSRAANLEQAGLATWSGLAALSNEARDVYVQKELAFRKLIEHLREDPMSARLWIPTAESYRKMDISTRPIHPDACSPDSKSMGRQLRRKIKCCALVC